MSKIKIAGLDLKWFIIISAVIIAGCALGAFPAGMVGAFRWRGSGLLAYRSGCRGGELLHIHEECGVP